MRNCFALPLNRQAARLIAPIRRVARTRMGTDTAGASANKRFHSRLSPPVIEYRPPIEKLENLLGHEVCARVFQTVFGEKCSFCGTPNQFPTYKNLPNFLLRLNMFIKKCKQ